MLKVVGQDPKAVKRVTHSKCGAVIEYHPIDVFELWSGKDCSGGSDGAEGFKCPNCGENVIIRRW